MYTLRVRKSTKRRPSNGGGEELQEETAASWQRVVLEWTNRNHRVKTVAKKRLSTMWLHVSTPQTSGAPRMSGRNLRQSTPDIPTPTSMVRRNNREKRLRLDIGRHECLSPLVKKGDYRRLARCNQRRPLPFTSSGPSIFLHVRMSRSYKSSVRRLRAHSHVCNIQPEMKQKPF